MLATPKPKPATYADLVALPANLVGEIVNGTLHAQPRPAPRHGLATVGIVAQLNDPFDYRRMGDGPGGWIFLVEPELHLGPQIVVPDIAGWRIERLTPFPETAHIETPPDWVCEVLSPSTARFDRIEKLPLYGSFGIGHAWYVDPIACTLEVFALNDGKWQIAANFTDAAAVTAPPFEAHTFPLDVLWPASLPPAP